MAGPEGVKLINIDNNYYNKTMDGNKI